MANWNDWWTYEGISGKKKEKHSIQSYTYKDMIIDTGDMINYFFLFKVQTFGADSIQASGVYVARGGANHPSI